MRAGESIDQLPSDPHPTAGFAHRALEDVADAELPPDLLHVDRLALVGETRIAGDHEQPADARERSDDLLDHAICEIFLLRVAAHVGERQNGDRRLVRQSEDRREFDRRSGSLNRGGPNPVDPYRASDVFQVLLTHILERKVKLTRCVLLHTGRNADAARIGQCFQASGNVHSITENVTVFDDNIANIDAYSKFDAFFGGGVRITLGHYALDLTRTPQSIDNTRKLDQQAVSGGFDDAPSVFPDLRIGHFGADRS